MLTYPRTAELPNPRERRFAPLVWTLALLAAGVVGASAASPIAGVALLGLILFGLLFAWSLKKPVNAFLVALLFFPFYPMLRGWARVTHLPIPLDPVGMWPELVLTVMLLSIVIRACKTGERLRLTVWDIPMVFLTVGGFYGIALTLPDKQYFAAVYGIHYSLTAVLFYFAARWAKVTEIDLKRILNVLTGSFVVMALASLFDFVVRTNFSVRIATELRAVISAKSGVPPDVFWRVYPRMQSLMFDENLWGTVCFTVAFLMLAVLVTPIFSANRPRPAIRWSIPIFLIATICMALTLSRGAAAGYVVGFGAILLLAGRYKHRIVLLGMALLIVSGIALTFLWSHPRVIGAINRITSVSDSSSTVAYDRVEMWNNALENFEMFPSGSGIGTAGQAAVYHGGSAVVTDGQYFKVLAEMGVPGVLTWICGFIGILGVLYALLWRAEGIDRMYGLTAYACVIGQLVQNVGSNASDFYYTPVVTWAFCGFFIARRIAAQTAKRDG